MGQLRHQLRTPVNHIVGFSEMLQEQAADCAWDALLPDLERIRQAGRGLVDVVSSMIDTNRVEAGRLDAGQVSEALRTPLESIVGYSQLLQEEAEERGWLAALPDLRKVESAAMHLTSLIDTVLELARLYTTGAPARPAHPRQPGAAARLGAHRTGASTILLADDNELDADMLRRRLQQLGYQISLAHSGLEALALVQEHTFDLLLLDVLMPEMDGLEALRSIKSVPATSDTPVLMISAMEEIPIVARCIELGADDYLTKPVEPILLRAKIDAALERRRLRRVQLEYHGDLAVLTAAAAAVGAQTLPPAALAEIAARDDPLGRLARVFQRMASQVRERDASRQRATRLRASPS